MNKAKKYIIEKSKFSEEDFTIPKTKMSGFELKPKNQIPYDGIKVNSLLMVKPAFVEKVLKKKNKRKVEYYLNYIIELLDSDDADPTGLSEALNDLKKYRDIIKYKYSKYLDDKYIELLLRKINVLEKQLNARIMYYDYMNHEVVEEEKKGKTR